MNNNLISIDDFAKIDIRVGTIIDCSAVEGSGKLLKETVDFGNEIGTKTILSGIRKWYNPEDLIGKQAVFVVNLPSRKMMGNYDSEGMIMVAEHEDMLVILKPARKMPNGARIR